MVRTRKRALGEGGPRVGAIGLGCMGDLVREVASLHEATAAQVALMASSPAIAGRRPHTHREAQALIQLSHGGVVVIAVEQRQP